jgi:hypothetical protein
LPLEAVLAGISPLIGITGDIAFDRAEGVGGSVIIATMLLPYQTRDSEIAAEVFNFLTGKGLSIFLSTFTLEQLGASDRILF